MARPFDPAEVLEQPLVAFLATTAEDGGARVAPVWFIWEDGALWMPGSARGLTVGRIARDARVSVEILGGTGEGEDLRRLGLRGRASIEAMEADRFRRLLSRYLGPQDAWNPWFVDEIARADDPGGRLIRLDPASLFTNDMSYFRDGPVVATHTARL